MSQASDLTRCFAPYDQATTLIAVIELSLSSWLIAGMVPGPERQPLKKWHRTKRGCCGSWRDGGKKP